MITLYRLYIARPVDEILINAQLPLFCPALFVFIMNTSIFMPVLYNPLG